MISGNVAGAAPARGRGGNSSQSHEVPMLDRPATSELSFPSQRSSSSPSALDRLTAGIGGDAIWLLARCCIGGIFVYSGFGKLTGLDGFAASLAKNGVPMADVMATVGASVEFFGGLAIVLGLQTRYAALLMAAFTISATLISHRFWELQDAAAFKQQSVHFMKNLAILGAFLLLFVQGGGRLSFDGWRRRAR
jgi:putative oxidoreductase